jgi:hypothetical protein
MAGRLDMKFKTLILTSIPFILVSTFCYSQIDTGLTAGAGIKSIQTAVLYETKIPIMVNRTVDATYNRVKVVALNSPYGEVCIKLSTDKNDNKFDYTFTPDRPGKFTLMIQASDQRFPPAKEGIATDTIDVTVENPKFAVPDIAPDAAEPCVNEDVFLDFSVKGLPTISDYKIITPNQKGSNDTILGSTLQISAEKVLKGQTIEVKVLYKNKEFFYYAGPEPENYDPKNYKNSKFSFAIKEKPSRIDFAQKLNQKIKVNQGIELNARKCCSCIGTNAEPMSLADLKDMISETTVKVVGQEESENLFDDEREFEEIARGRFAFYLKEDLARQLTTEGEDNTVNIEVSMKFRTGGPAKIRRFKLDLSAVE